MGDITLGKYEHYKKNPYEIIGVAKEYESKNLGNKISQFICTARHSETLKELMIYKLIGCDSKERDNVFWYRLRNMHPKNAENKLGELVIYKALYDSEKFGNKAWWWKPKKMFLETVNVDGEEVPRFKYVGKD